MKDTDFVSVKINVIALASCLPFSSAFIESETDLVPTTIQWPTPMAAISTNIPKVPSPIPKASF